MRWAARRGYRPGRGGSGPGSVARGARGRTFRVPEGVLALMLSFLPAGGLLAEDRTLVPGVDGEWSELLMKAVGAVSRGDASRGVPVLIEAMESEDDVLVRVPWSLDASLDEIARSLGGGAGGAGRAVSPRAGAGEEARRHGRRYLRLEAAARSIVARLPAEILDAYAARFEEVDERLHARHAEQGDLRAFERLAGTYFFTSRGAEARELLGDRDLEAGRSRRAATLYHPLVEQALGKVAGESSENEPGDTPAATRAHRVGLKLLMAFRRSGEGELYRRTRDRIKASLEGRPIAAAFGRSVDGLESRVPLVPLDEREPVSLPSRWGGELEVGRLPELPGDVPEEPLALSWDFWWDPLTIESATPGLDRHRRALEHRRFGAPFVFGSTIDYPFIPLVDGGRVWVSGVHDIYRIDGRRGHGSVIETMEKPRPVRRASSGRYREKSDSAIYAATLWKRALEAPGVQVPPGVPDEVLIARYVSDRIHDLAFMGYSVTEEIPLRSLVAVDPRSGRTLWRTTPLDGELERKPDERAEPGADDGAFPRQGVRFEHGRRDARELYGPVEVPAHISYTSPVVVRGGVVYAAGWNEQGYVNSLVRALDLATGELVWEAHIASSQMEATMFGETAREPFASFLVERDGVLYCQTNLGAVGAIDRATGDVLWVSTYETIPPRPTLGPAAQKRSLAWSVNPPLLLGDTLIAAPRDSDYLYALDTGSGPGGESAGGRILWRYDNSDGDLRDLLGYHRERLYFTGPAGVSYLDLEGLEPGTRSGEGPRKKLGNLSPRRGAIVARGALTGGGVLYTDRQKLWLVDLDLGWRRPVGTLPESAHGERAGRVRMEEGYVLVTSNELVSAFVPEGGE